MLMPLALAGCGGDEPPPEIFQPLHYEYLTRLRLNVGSVEVQDHSASLGDDDVSGQAPTPPSIALSQMAHDRLFAAGLTGQAIFVIDQASIVRGPSGVLDGQMAVHLEVTTTGGTRAGYAEARVSRQHIPGSEEENLRSVLYDMTKQMMSDMNVELEFQIRHSMSDWLVAGNDVPSRVTVAPLQAPTPPPGSPDMSIPGVVMAPRPRHCRSAGTGAGTALPGARVSAPPAGHAALSRSPGGSGSRQFGQRALAVVAGERQDRTRCE
ncbi:MAG: hypothetical protein WDN04_01880 [Rhodospirillales bacterium]